MNKNGVCKKLIDCLDEMVKLYRHLLEVVRTEKELLITANVDGLEKSNESKEIMLSKIRALESLRGKCSRELATELGMKDEAPRLLVLARNVSLEEGDRLRSLHSVLDLLVKRVREYNEQNQVLAEAGLKHVTGALGAIRDSLREDKPVYKRQGEVSLSPLQSGQLVRREA